MICIGHPCPNCGEYGGMYAVRNKKKGVLWIYCDECDVLWRTLEDANKNIVVENNKEEFEWGGYATEEEVIAFGWKKY